MKPYAGLFLTDHAHRHDSNLALRYIHKTLSLLQDALRHRSRFRDCSRAKFYCPYPLLRCCRRLQPWRKRWPSSWLNLCPALEHKVAEKWRQRSLRNTGFFMFFLLGKVPREVVGEQGVNWPHFESILTLLAASRQTQIGVPRIAGLDYW